MLRSPRHKPSGQHQHRARRGLGRRAPARIAPFAAGFALCYLIFGGDDDDTAARAELAREKAEAAARHAAEAATAAEIAERAAVRGEVRGSDPYLCPVRVPSSMRYWRTVQELPGDALPYDVEAYLTFVPDFGGLNNVRLSLENVLSLARASGRVLVPVWKSTSASGAQFFTKSFLRDDAAVLAPTSGEKPASPRHRAGIASMAWRTNAP